MQNQTPGPAEQRFPAIRPSSDRTAVLALTTELVAIDSRSSRSNLGVAERCEAALAGFEIERIDYLDPNGVAKRCLVAHRGPPGGYALSGHMDTVPETGWTEDPFAPRLRDGVLYGLGSVDMKGPVAACILAAQSLPAHVPATLLLTTDEETTKQGARAVASADVARRLGLKGILVAEPTEFRPIRGHRSSIGITATASGVQAHSASGLGVNANWALIPFLAEMRAIHEALRSDPAMQDAGYAPPFCDFNLVLDNHGTAVNVTAARATCRIKFRHSRRIDPAPILARVRAAAEAHGVALVLAAEGRPPELAADHPLIALAERLTGQASGTVPFGTDASELQELAPCVVLGPGSISTAHTPGECVEVADLERAVGLFARFLESAAA